MKRNNFKFKIGLSSFYIIILAFININPQFAERHLKMFFSQIPQPITYISYDYLFSVTIGGFILFILTMIGRFEEYKLTEEKADKLANQIDLIHYYSNWSSIFPFYLIIILVIKSSFSDQMVIDNLKYILYALIISTYFMLFFITINSLLFDPGLKIYKIINKMIDYGVDESNNYLKKK